MVLEVVVLCMQYTEDTETSLEVNIVSIAVAGTIAAAICIPGMLVFAAAFHPQILVNLAMWAIPLIFSCPAKCWRAKKRVLRFLFCWPCMLRRAVRVTCGQVLGVSIAASGGATPGDTSTSAP